VWSGGGRLRSQVGAAASGPTPLASMLDSYPSPVKVPRHAAAREELANVRETPVVERPILGGHAHR
jgi:hypothetical protein